MNDTFDPVYARLSYAGKCMARQVCRRFYRPPPAFVEVLAALLPVYMDVVNAGGVYTGRYIFQCIHWIPGDPLPTARIHVCVSMRGRGESQITNLHPDAFIYCGPDWDNVAALRSDYKYTIDHVLFDGRLRVYDSDIFYLRGRVVYDRDLHSPMYPWDRPPVEPLLGPRGALVDPVEIIDDAEDIRRDLAAAADQLRFGEQSAAGLREAVRILQRLQRVCPHVCWDALPAMRSLVNSLYPWVCVSLWYLKYSSGRVCKKCMHGLVIV